MKRPRDRWIHDLRVGDPSAKYRAVRFLAREAPDVEVLAALEAACADDTTYFDEYSGWGAPAGGDTVRIGDLARQALTRLRPPR